MQRTWPRRMMWGVLAAQTGQKRSIERKVFQGFGRFPSTFSLPEGASLHPTCRSSFRPRAAANSRQAMVEPDAARNSWRDVNAR